MDPALPFDLFEFTFLVDGFYSNMTSIDLLVFRIQQLEKREEDLEKAAATLAAMRFTSKRQFERRFAHRLTNKEFIQGELVLVRNTQIEKELDHKAKPRYLGPYVVERRTRGGAYELREADGTRLRDSVAAFRILPYILRNQEALAELTQENLGLPESEEEDLSEGYDDVDNEL